tara:strand:+ start:962 stop:1273 length:312 start_codon:yes stop_codon:yes gene_type:complete
MSSKTTYLRSPTIDIQVVAEECCLSNQELTENDIEVMLRKRVLFSYPTAYKFTSLIKEILDKDVILYRLYAKVTVPIDKATKQMFGFNPVPKTRFELIIDEMD